MTVQSKEVTVALTNGVKPGISLPQAFTSTRVSVEYFADQALETPATPSAGTLLFESSDAKGGGTGWVKMRDGRVQAADVDTYPRPFTDKPAYYLRVTPEDVVGADYARLTIWQDESMAADPIDLEAYGGSVAINTQDRVLANIVRGKQFFIRAAWPLADPIPALETRKIHFQVGDSPVWVFLRIFEYIGEELVLRLFASPSGVTGGTPVTISNWNTVNPQTSVGTVTKDVSTTDDGVEVIEPEYFFGGDTVAARSVTSIPENRQRAIPANSDFILSITNNNGQDARCQYFLDWYEGELDLPLPLT